MRVGIAGAAGYTAGELIRILIGHPGAVTTSHYHPNNHRNQNIFKHKS